MPRLLKSIGDALGDIGEYAANYQVADQERKYREAQDKQAQGRWDQTFGENKRQFELQREDNLAADRKAADKLLLEGALDFEEEQRDPKKRIERMKASVLQKVIEQGLDPDKLPPGEQMLFRDAVDYKADRGLASDRPSYANLLAQAKELKGITTNRLAGRASGMLSKANPSKYSEMSWGKTLNPKSGQSLRAAAGNPEFYGAGGMNPSDSTVLAAVLDSLTGAENAPSSAFMDQLGNYDDGGDIYDPQTDPEFDPAAELSGRHMPGRTPQYLIPKGQPQATGDQSLSLDDFVKEHPEFYQLSAKEQDRLLTLLQAKRGYK